MRNHCAGCGQQLKPLFTSQFCPNGCDLPLDRRQAPRITMDSDDAWDAPTPQLSTCFHDWKKLDPPIMAPHGMYRFTHSCTICGRCYPP